MCRLVPREVAVSSTYSLCRVLKCRLVSREVAVSSRILCIEY